MYFTLSFIANLAGAVFAGVQFARVSVAIKDSNHKNRDISLSLSSGMLAFAIPFFSPISHNLGASVSLFIALCSVSTLVVSRSID